MSLMILLEGLLYTTLNQLVDALTGLERILTTPMPISCVSVKHLLLLILTRYSVTRRTYGWSQMFIVQLWYAGFFPLPPAS